MKVITKNAEIQLFEQAELFSNQSRDGWQCIYFQVPEKWQKLASFDIRIIADLLAKTKGTLYQCGNGDTFILFRGTLSTVQLKLARYLWALETGHITSQPGYSLFSVIDLGRNWDSFYKLCEDKYLKSLAASEILRHIHTPHPAPTALLLTAMQQPFGRQKR